MDDINTNLKVAEGLLPYGMRVKLCGVGREAIESISAAAGEERYDVVLMDHMMPEMDGIETVARIRALQREDAYYKNVPIIALTANAVSGTKEMFLENGFDDFLSKPIDTVQLNALLEKWIPKEKRRAADKKTSGQSVTALSASKILSEINGLDTKKGMITTGGTEAGYRRVLEQYCRDANARSEFLTASRAESDLKDFITQVHALKSASASIGAAGLSGEAGELEDAGRRGDAAFIRERAGAFRDNLVNLTLSITAALNEKGEKAAREDDETDKAGKTGKKSPDEKISRLLSRLREALEAEDVWAADAILAELLSIPLNNEISETVSRVSDMALISEFAEAVKVIDGSGIVKN